MSLLVSLKNKVVSNIALLPDAFRQIENWANAYTFHPLNLATNWSNLGPTYDACGWYVNPFGEVRFTGAASYAGPAIANGASSLIATLPPGIVPRATNVRFPWQGYTGAAMLFGLLWIDGSQLLWINFSGAGQAAVDVFLDGVTYYPQTPVG
jgi:hypothetical protein